MKYFKLFDAGIQAMITVVAIVLFNRYSFGLFYFGLGGWQVFSCLVHATVYKREERSIMRRKYEKVLVGVLGIAAASGGVGLLGIEAGYLVLGFEACLMLVGGLAMAIIYWTECLTEIRKLFDGEKMNRFDDNQHNHIQHNLL
jgi:hypothetical protein